MATYRGTKGNAAFILNLDTRAVSGELRALADLAWGRGKPLVPVE